MTPVVDRNGVLIESYPLTVVEQGGIRVVSPWDVTVDGVDYTVPQGYFSNFASIPGIARAVISPVDPSITLGAILHDYLVGEFGGGLVTTWGRAAKALKSCMKACGAPSWKRWLVYSAVMIYGAFKGKTDADFSDVDDELDRRGLLDSDGRWRTYTGNGSKGNADAD